MVLQKVNTFYTKLETKITDLVTNEEWMYFLEIDSLKDEEIVALIYNFVINIEEGFYGIYTAELVLFLKETWNTFSIALNENKADIEKQLNA